jgi:hypothetical protein
MSQPLTDEGVLTAARSTDTTLSALAHEVMQHRGLRLPLRVTSITPFDAAAASGVETTGWDQHDDEHDGTTMYVRFPVEIHHDWPAAAVPASVPARNYAPLTPARNYELVRDEVVADVVLSMSRTVDHGEAKHEVEYITILACERVVVIDAREWDTPDRRWVTVSTETTRTPLDTAEVDDALHRWAEQGRCKHGIDPLASALRDGAVEIVDAPELFRPGVKL